MRLGGKEQVRHRETTTLRERERERSTQESKVQTTQERGSTIAMNSESGQTSKGKEEDARKEE